MNKAAFIYGFSDELEKLGVAFLAPLAATAGRALAAEGVSSLIGNVAKNVGPKIIKPSKGSTGSIMSKGSKGGRVPNLSNKMPSIPGSLGGIAEIMRARRQDQPANAGNTITTPK